MLSWRLLYFVLDISSNEQGIAMPVAGWRLGFLGLPRFLAPRSDTREYQDKQGRFRFDVRLSLPLVAAAYRPARALSRLFNARKSWIFSAWGKAYDAVF